MASRTDLEIQVVLAEVLEIPEAGVLMALAEMTVETTNNGIALLVAQETFCRREIVENAMNPDQ